MIGNVLIFLAIVLLIIPTWMSLTLLPKQKRYSASDFLQQIISGPKEYNPIFLIINAFRLWGFFWLICGATLKFIPDEWLTGIKETLVYSFVFLLPMVLITARGVISSNKGNVN